MDGIDHWNFLSGHYDDRHHGEVDDDADGDDSLLLTLFSYNDDSHHGEVDIDADGDDSLLLTLSIVQYWSLGLVPGK